jgi:RNA polymerase sigma-70 factor (ECF subfamily)
LREQSKRSRFEQTVLPHLDAAYNLARWLTRDDADAEDVMQEAYLRAFRFFDGFHGDNSRAWLLKIVRNSCYTWRQQNRVRALATEFDEQVHSGESETPEIILLGTVNTQLLKRALETLPPEFREAVILRELEGFSYREIADITEVPVGTVMSRLARARKRLQQCLAADTKEG